MHTIRVRLLQSVDHSYDIAVGAGVMGRVAGDLAASAWGQRYALICDLNTKQLFAERLLAEMADEDLACEVFAVAAGEGSKRLAVLEELQERMLKAGITRKDCVVALGGGVVGDLAGFAAATYMRGIPFVQVPTTLLAQVDSSVGGKVAVNLPGGKNSCGVFAQPAKVWADLDALSTLPQEQLANGLAEVVKYAVILDRELFEILERRADDVLGLDPALMADIVARCCRIKARVVEKDEREGGHRMLLNYGHTFGHAIEKATGHKMEHGRAVAFGMRAAGRLAVLEGCLDEAALARQNALVKRLGLARGRLALSAERLIELTARDKKADASGTPFILAHAIGRAEIHRGPNPDNLRQALEDILE